MLSVDRLLVFKYKVLELTLISRILMDYIKFKYLGVMLLYFSFSLIV